MARLILTEEEKDASSWFDIDDADLGRVVKKMGSLMLPQDEKDKMLYQACAMMLVSYVQDAGGVDSTVYIDEMTIKDVDVGSWEVNIKKVSK